MLSAIKCFYCHNFIVNGEISWDSVQTAAKCWQVRHALGTEAGRLVQ